MEAEVKKKISVRGDTIRQNGDRFHQSFMFLFVFYGMAQLVILCSYSWHCTKESLPVGSWNHMGCQEGKAFDLPEFYFPST